MRGKIAESIFFTKNGEGELVVMDIETYNRREKMLKLREELLAVEEDRMRGRSAEQLTAEFEKTANSLEIMPQRCPWLTGEYIPRNAYRFILFEKRYMIIFQIVDDIGYADYVVDCRQDYGW